MGYDVAFVQIDVPEGTTFPVTGSEASDLVARAEPIADIDAVKEALCQQEGCKPGPDDTIDFLGKRLGYARLRFREKDVYIENNCNAKDLLSLHEVFQPFVSGLYILDLQTGQLHDPESYRSWWARPL